MATIRLDWWSKSAAGVVLGFGLAMALCGLFAWLSPGGPAATNKYQLTMWLAAPLWAGVLGFVFLFRSGLQAWLWLGGANVLAFGGLYACRHFLS
jgi:hypothetical protein